MSSNFKKATFTLPVDLVIYLQSKENQAAFVAEALRKVKESEQDIDSNLNYLLNKVKIPYAFQVHLDGEKFKRLPDINGSKVHIIPAHIFLVNLP